MSDGYSFLRRVLNYRATAREHKEADARMGRKWLCQCGACRQTRRELHIKGNARRP